MLYPFSDKTLLKRPLNPPLVYGPIVESVDQGKGLHFLFFFYHGGSCSEFIDDPEPSRDHGRRRTELLLFLSCD